MNMNDKEIIQEFKETRGLNKKTITDYEYTFRKYVEFQGLSLNELLNEAEQEEIMEIRLKNRTIKKRLINWKNYLTDNYSRSSVNSHTTRVKALYRHHEIELPYLPQYKSKQLREYEPIYYQDLPDKEIIKEAINISNPLMKAIILFISSSGCARRETLSLTIQQFKESVKDYTTKDSIHEILDDLKTRKNIVPTFRIKRFKTNKFYYTFCSPEATSAIISYLLTRTDKLNDDSKLFNVNIHYFTELFNEVNDKLNLGKVGAFNRFRSHMLRKFHASNLMMGENPLTLDEIDSLQGRSKNIIRQSYFLEDHTVLKKKYIRNIHQVVINAQVTTIDTPEVQQMKLENEQLKAEREELIEKTKEENKEMVLSILKNYGLELK